MSDQQMIDPDDQFQEWIDDLLQTSIARPAAPRELRSGLVQVLKGKRRRNIAMKTAMAAVLATVFCLPFIRIGSDPNLVQIEMKHDHQEALEEVATLSPDVEVLPTEAEAPRKVIFVPDADHLVVEIESPSPNVTILEVHPTLSARRHREREKLLHTTLATYNGGS